MIIPREKIFFLQKKTKNMTARAESVESALLSLADLSLMITNEASRWKDKDDTIHKRTNVMFSLLSDYRSMIRNGEYTKFATTLPPLWEMIPYIRSCFISSDSVNRDEIEGRIERAISLFVDSTNIIIEIAADQQRRLYK